MHRDDDAEIIAAARVGFLDEAADMLQRARAEVAKLASRRDNIASELGHLSGVIEALAVPVPIVQDNDTDNPDNAE